MKKLLIFLMGLAVGLAIAWVWFVPGRYDVVARAWASAQPGDSRQLIVSLLGEPDSVRDFPETEKSRDGLTEENYQFFLNRYAFLYGRDGRLADKSHFQSE